MGRTMGMMGDRSRIRFSRCGLLNSENIVFCKVDRGDHAMASETGRRGAGSGGGRTVRIAITC